MHVEIIANAPIPQHERVINWLKEREYAYEGKVRKGYNKPFITETRHYDIRIKKECLSQLMADLNALGVINFDSPNIKDHVGGVGTIDRIFNKIIKIGSRFLPINYINTTKYPIGKEKPEGWFYTKVLFTMDDPPAPDNKDTELI